MVAERKTVLGMHREFADTTDQAHVYRLRAALQHDRRLRRGA
jgi:hypothetical protein